MATRAHSFRIFVALVAWLAQLCLPMAHAASMAATGLGTAAWCGANSPALRAQLAQLPSEIRQILEDSTSLTDHADDCAQCCASANGVAVPKAGGITIALRAAGLEPSAFAPVPSHPLPSAAPPPARGPPVHG